MTFSDYDFKNLITLIKNNTKKDVYLSFADSNSLPYYVIDKYQEVYDYADNTVENVTQFIQIDYYTNNPLDTEVDNIKTLLNDNEIAFTYSHSYEDSVYHHILEVVM